jgi:phage antirepressor YoqD-like protein
MTTIALSPAVLKAVKDGIEFYTIQTTGESGMSSAGLARACGLDPSTISKLLKALVNKSPSDILEPFVGNSLDDLSLMTNSSLNNANILKDTFCAAVITHYAKAGKIEAANNVCRFAAAGIRTFIHSQTGWKPQEPEYKLPTNFLESLEMLVAVERERASLAAVNEELLTTNSELVPKAQAAEILLKAKDNLTFQEAAQLLNIPDIGRNNLFKILVKLKYLIDTAHPYQKYVDLGIFTVIEKTTAYGGAMQQVLITQKGIQYLIPKLAEQGYKSSKVAEPFKLYAVS